tara:strand:+ start:275 stop:541 length:267 start_codon:yes stop_codon:yes gene_type:complete
MADIKIRTFDNTEILTINHNQWESLCMSGSCDVDGVIMNEGEREYHIQISGKDYTWYQPKAEDTDSLIVQLRTEYADSGSVVIAQIME